MSSNVPIIDPLKEMIQGGRPSYIPFFYWSSAFHLDIEEDSKFRLSN
jgi:hypothetical protein